MDYEVINCIDAGTEFCPCSLAEVNQCLLCSQLAGKNFCDCTNWTGVCIYQEYIWNGKCSKAGRSSIDCKIIEISWLQQSIFKLKVSIPNSLARALIYPGSYIYIKPIKYSDYFFAPISIMECDVEHNSISLLIEVKGIKTTLLSRQTIGDIVSIKGPYWNGIQGLKNINNCKNSNVIFVLRGIGQAPSLPVLNKLSLEENNNNITIFLDETYKKLNLINDYKDKDNVTIIKCSTLDKGLLKKDFSLQFQNLIKTNNYQLVHCGGPDILSYRLVQEIESACSNVTTSCCNNFKMCCGEGICGSCTIKTKDHKLRKMCKLQTEPQYFLKGRRKH